MKRVWQKSLKKMSYFSARQKRIWELCPNKGLKVKVQEGAGVSLRMSVVTGDLGAGQPCPMVTVPLPQR